MRPVRPCPQCGATTSQAMSFCTACGMTLDAELVAAARPTGKVVRPGIAALLAAVAFGIYPYVFWWRASREVDAFVSTNGRANKAVRIGVVLAVGGTLLTIGALLAVVVPARVAAMEAGLPSPDEAALTDLAVRHPVFMAGTLALLAGTVFMYRGMMGAWLAVRSHQLRGQRASDAINPALLLGLLVAGAAGQTVAYLSGVGLLGLLNVGAVVTVVYLTQKHLNAVWLAGGQAPAPKPSVVSTPPAPVRPAARANRSVRPWLVGLLTIVTTGVYAYFFFWRTSREVDEVQRIGRPSGSAVRVGVVLALAGFALHAAILFRDFPASLLWAGRALGPDPSEIAVILALEIAGSLILAFGMRRAWLALEEADARASRPPVPARRLTIGLSAAIGLQWGALLTPDLWAISLLQLPLLALVTGTSQRYMNAVWASEAARSGAAQKG